MDSIINAINQGLEQIYGEYLYFQIGGGVIAILAIAGTFFLLHKKKIIWSVVLAILVSCLLGTMVYIHQSISLLKEEYCQTFENKIKDGSFKIQMETFKKSNCSEYLKGE